MDLEPLSRPDEKDIIDPIFYLFIYLFGSGITHQVPQIKKLWWAKIINHGMRKFS